VRKYFDRGTISLTLLCLAVLVIAVNTLWQARSPAPAVVIRKPGDTSAFAGAPAFLSQSSSEDDGPQLAAPSASMLPRTRLAGNPAAGPVGDPIPPRHATVKQTQPKLPWPHSGRCAASASVEVEEGRARYRGTFISTPAWHTTIYVAPGAPPSAVESVRSRLERIHELSVSQLGLDSEPPLIYVYPSVEEVRAHSCTSKIAVSYYDGAIHLAADDTELESSLRHEYAHHVLVSNGIAGPMWFQEGAAMAFGRDCPTGAWKLWRAHRFDPKQMISALPPAASLATVTEFNAQACIMMEFLERLCLTLRGCGTTELTHALDSGEATPDTLFNWAISRRGADLFRTSPLRMWDDYAERGDFAPATKAALLQRAGLGRGQP
jgi:hypothetical protein